MSRARWVVTGGGGFIGSNLVEALLAEGQDVVAFDDFSTGRRSNLERATAWASAGGGSFRLVEGDIRDLALCGKTLAGADHVLHQAAIPSVPRSVAEPLLTNAVNVGGTLNLLEAAREAGVSRFVFASSSSIYGESEELPKVETMRSAPISPYGLQKLTAESYCLLYRRLFGLPTVALRYFNIFGPRQDPNSPYSAVISRFLDAVSEGRRPTIYGDGEQTRDFTFVANAVQANLAACRVDEAACGRAYNVGCGERISLNQLLAQIGTLVGRRVEASHEAARAGDILHSLAGIEKAREALGYQPAVGLAEGLKRTLAAG